MGEPNLGPIYSPHTIAADLYPNRINPLSVLNNVISRNERTTKVSRRRDDHSVCRIADSNQRNREPSSLTRRSSLLSTHYTKTEPYRLVLLQADGRLQLNLSMSKSVIKIVGLVDQMDRLVFPLLRNQRTLRFGRNRSMNK